MACRVGGGGSILTTADSASLRQNTITLAVTQHLKRRLTIQEWGTRWACAFPVASCGPPFAPRSRETSAAPASTNPSSAGIAPRISNACRSEVVAFRSRWGSCTKQGQVVIHELAHQVQPNHSLELP